eukprot:GHVQ01013280.1.p2 GENE.GHVQ01013280.1~~GHVQ01013280.1.p2  ORF type:complete len:161 (+),score=18.81 GHVQ01013280.1:234-716(+)
MMKEGCSLLIRNLRYETSPAKLRRVFEEFGQVRDVYLPLDHFNKKPRGFGFVEFFDERDAREAQRALDRTKLDGNEICVVTAQDRRKSPESMRRLTDEQNRARRTGGGGYGGGGGRFRRERSPNRGGPRYRSPSRDKFRDRNGRVSCDGIKVQGRSESEI